MLPFVDSSIADKMIDPLNQFGGNNIAVEQRYCPFGGNNKLSLVGH